MNPEARVLRSPDYQRILETEKLLTFVTIVGGIESHHQISIVEYDTKEKIEARMAEVLVQVAEELTKNNAVKKSPDTPIPTDIQEMVDTAVEYVSPKEAAARAAAEVRVQAQIAIQEGINAPVK